METAKNGWSKVLLVGMAVMVLLFGLVVAGCASGPQRPTSIKIGQAALNGKNAVILPIQIVDRVKPKNGDSNAGGLPGAALNALAVNDWVKNVEDVAKKNSGEITERVTIAYSSFSEQYNKTNNTSLIERNFDYGKRAPNIDWFSNPSKDTKAQIVKLCNESGAEYLISILYQFVDGNTVSVFTSSDSTRLSAIIIIIDKNGNVVSKNYAQTGTTVFRFVYPKGQEQQDLKGTMLELYDALKDVLVNSVSSL